MESVTVGNDSAHVGEEVLIRLRKGLDRRTFGSGWRIGTITELAPGMVALSDEGPLIRTRDIDHMSVVTPDVSHDDGDGGE